MLAHAGGVKQFGVANLHALLARVWLQVEALLKSHKLVNVSPALAYAMQILCADPEQHLIDNHPTLWANDHTGYFRERLPKDGPWLWRHPLRAEAVHVQPAVIQLVHAESQSA